MAGINCGKLDIRDIPQDEIISNDNFAWVKAEVEEKIYIYNDRPCVVIKFSEPCFATICNDQDPIPRGLLSHADSTNNGVSGSSGNDSGGSIDTDTGNTHTTQAYSSSTTSGENKENLETAAKAVDAAAINSRGYAFSAVMPSAAAVPMRSNIKPYGPYCSNNFYTSAGGIQAETNTDLAPWVFGSIQAMNTAGNSLAQNAVIGVNKAGTGSIAIPGLPISQFTGLGVALAGTGPTLSAMNFSYGSGGISTTYEFRTYTPKFGSLNRHLLDRVKTISKNRTEQIRFLRGNQINLNKIGRKNAAVAAKQRRRENADKHKRGQGTLQRVLVAGIQDWQEQRGSPNHRTVVGIDTLSKSVVEMAYDYDKKAYMSLDGLFGPVSKEGSGSLPQYASYEIGDHKSSSQLAQPPFALDEEPTNSENDVFASGLNLNNLEISQKYIDPLTNKLTEDSHHHDGDGSGHVIDLVGRETEVPEKGMVTNFYHLDDEERYSDDYRFLGMRGPIVLHSWGYDTEGKPIPNESDSEEQTKQGEFTKDNLADRFLTDWLGKPKTWPVAPIDFRFDRKRGVWVTPPGYKVVVAKLEEKLEAYGEAEASLINEREEKKYGDDLVDKDGDTVVADGSAETEAKIKIVDRIGASLAKGTKCYAYYDTYNSEYVVLKGGGQESIRFRLIDFCEGTPPEPDYGGEAPENAWTKHAGYLDKFPNNHVLGVRINCEGDPVDSNGDIITFEDIEQAVENGEDGDDPEAKKPSDIFVSLYDTCGVHGPAYAYYALGNGAAAFTDWKDRASTGFGILCKPAPETTCSLGEGGTQCQAANNPIYTGYDIVFLDSYARFVECKLKQKLYMTSDDAEKEFPEDEYKKEHPEGNAEAEILHFYGGSPNRLEPKFYKLKAENGGAESIPFRVFDPFQDAEDQQKNPFSKLDYDDRVLAVFDEKRKKYVIYNAMKLDEKVIKFALVDNKDTKDRKSRAVLVDAAGYPIDNSGKKLTEENFADNFIEVVDSFAIHGHIDPVPNFHNNTNSFGPALGSDEWEEHMNGIPVHGGDQDPPPLPDGTTPEHWTNYPFIGFAIQRPWPSYLSRDLDSVDNESPSSDPSTDTNEIRTINEIFFLENFAEIIVGKIGVKKAEYGLLDQNEKYYPSVVRAGIQFNGGYYKNGHIPFTRDPIDATHDQEGTHDDFNVRVVYDVDRNSERILLGDKYDSGYRTPGDIYRSVDGCSFMAKLDRFGSHVNEGYPERLRYVIIETQSLATVGYTAILDQEKADELNKDITNEDAGEDKIWSVYQNGFMWDRQKSEENYKKVKIRNRADWVGKGLIIKNPPGTKASRHIQTRFNYYDENKGEVEYSVITAGTIAQVSEALVPGNLSGKFGLQGAVNEDELKINKFDTSIFYHGLNPTNSELEDTDNPKFKLGAQNWMTYEGANTVGLWAEGYAPEIKNNYYNIIYAREAPTLITGKVIEKFTPKDSENVQVDTSNVEYPSGPGVVNQPIPELITKARNPMGYGAEAGDYVTLQRVNSTSLVEGDKSNYYYIVIGAGAKPGNCS